MADTTILSTGAYEIANPERCDHLIVMVPKEGLVNCSRRHLYNAFAGEGVLGLRQPLAFQPGVPGPHGDVAFGIPRELRRPA